MASRLPIDSEGLEFGYHDSGSIPNNTYRTIFMLHGISYYSPIFLRLFPLASEHNLRLVAITRRDYPGTTPIDDEERHDVLQADLDGKLSFLKNRGQEFLKFILKFIHVNNIPPLSEDRTEGGVSVCGWSVGNLHMMTILALADQMPKELIDALSPYLKSFFIYEFHMIYRLPGGYNPLVNKLLTPETALSQFTPWVCGYYKHPDLSKRRLSFMELMNPSDHRLRADQNFTPDDLQNTTHGVSMTHCDVPFIHDAKLMETMVRRCFFPPSPYMFPGVVLCALWGNESVWQIPYAIWEMQRMLEEEEANNPAQFRRRFSEVLIEGGNHFAHWDDPEKVVHAFRKAIDLEH